MTSLTICQRSVYASPERLTENFPSLSLSLSLCLSSTSSTTITPNSSVAAFPATSRPRITDRPAVDQHFLPPPLPTAQSPLLLFYNLTTLPPPPSRFRLPATFPT